MNLSKKPPALLAEFPLPLMLDILRLHILTRRRNWPVRALSLDWSFFNDRVTDRVNGH